MEQIFIAFTGIIAIWLTQSANAIHRKWACIFGLLGQPFWFYSAYSTEQWGILALTFFYTFAWIKGFYINWIKNDKTLSYTRCSS